MSHVWYTCIMCIAYMKWEIDKTDKFCAFNYKTDKIFVFKKFFPPDWSLSDNVSDWFS